MGHLTSSDPPRQPHIVQVVQAIDRGGLEMMAVDLAIALRQRGFGSSIVALTEGGRLEARLRGAGVPFESMGGARYSSPASHIAVARVLRRLRPTVVHTHHLPSLLNAGPSARALRVSRLVHTEHAHIYLDEEPRVRPLLRWGAQLADVVTLVGAALLPYYVRTVGLPESRLRVVPNGIDTARFRPVPRGEVSARRHAAGLPEDQVLVGAVGRLAPEKNYALLVRALARARAAGAPVAVALVGDGEEREPLQRLVRELALDAHVTFLGWRSDVANLVGIFDVLAVTSTSEALPLVVLEAMSAGVPVLSTAVGEIPRVLAGGAPDSDTPGDAGVGVLVPSGDLDAFARALVRLGGSEASRRAMGTRARARAVERYSHGAMVDAYLALYGLAGGGVQGARAPSGRALPATAAVR